jgi:hypothetical protein
MKRRSIALGLILLLGVAFGLAKIQRDAQTPEDRAFWEANGRKVTEGWEKGCAEGKKLAKERTDRGEYSISTRKLAEMASASIQDARITDPVTANSFKRGFVFGFHQGRNSPDER